MCSNFKPEICIARRKIHDDVFPLARLNQCLYIAGMQALIFTGSGKNDLPAFPEAAKPEDVKPEVVKPEDVKQGIGLAAIPFNWLI